MSPARPIIAAFLLAPAAASAGAPPPQVPAPLAPDLAATVSRDIVIGSELGHQGDLTFVGINAYQSVQFGIPDYWEVAGEPELRLDVVRSAMLIPEVSAMTVWLDGRPVGTFGLDGDPGGVSQEVVKLPIEKKDGFHKLEFVAYQRSRLPCELSDHPGLWSRLLGSSVLHVEYRPTTPHLALGSWPRPFRDQRDPDAPRIVLALSDEPSQDELQAAGYIASYLGHTSDWRAMDLYVHQGSIATAPAGHVIAVTRSDVPSTVLSELRGWLDASPEDELRMAGGPLRGEEMPGAGVLALGPRPGSAQHAILAVVGRDNAGVVALARLLSSEEAARLPVGLVERVDSVKNPGPMEPRRWDRTIPPETSFTLKDLKWQDRMATGFHGGTVTIPLNLVPDDHPIAGAARLELQYSYSAQADPANSRLDVFLNGAAVGGVALDEVGGRNHVKLLLELPVHEMGPESRLDVRFALLQKEEPTCIGEDREHLWGTVHADSRLTLPRERWSRAPDLAMTRFGAFPFALRPDLSETIFVLPEKPSRTELQLFAWLAGEMGRAARGNRFAYQVRLGAIGQEQAKDHDLVVVESGPSGDLMRKIGLLDSMSFTPKGGSGVAIALASGGAVELGADPRVAHFEQVLLPWNPGRTALVAYAAEAALFERVGRCLDGDALFDRLDGRVTRVASCLDLKAIPAEEARILGERPVREAAYEPIRNNYWLLLAGLALLVFVGLVARALWLALSRRGGDADEAGDAV